MKNGLMLLVCSVYLLLGSCTMREYVGVPPEVKLGGRKLAILPFTERGRETTLSQEVTFAVHALIKANCRRAKIVVPPVMPVGLDASSDLTVIAHALGVDVVLRADIKSFTLRPPRSIGFMKATAVVDCEIFADGAIAVKKDDWRIVYPQSTFEIELPDDSIKESALREYLLRQVALEIAGLFYRHKVPWYKAPH